MNATIEGRAIPASVPASRPSILLMNARVMSAMAPDASEAAKTAPAPVRYFRKVRIPREIKIKEQALGTAIRPGGPEKSFRS